ncbi:hypothetical protein Efla_004314 [Eimeria flavescens]
MVPRLDSQTGPPKTAQTLAKRTYLNAPRRSIAESRCISAVVYWLEAEGSFTTLPPSCKESEPLFKDHRNISFVVVLNASSGPKVDCARITCNSKGKSRGNDEVTEPAPPTPEPSVTAIIPVQPDEPEHEQKSEEYQDDTLEDAERRRLAAS